MCEPKFLRSRMVRATVSQEIRNILGCGLAGVFRRVQVLVPPSPQVFAAIDLPPEDLGSNKVYNLPILHPGQFVEFPLGAGQTLYAACSEGVAPVTLIIEEYEESPR